MKKILITNHGFTLIELLIAMSLFVTVMVATTILFGRAADTQGKAVAIKNLQEGVNYSMEFIKREAELSKKDLTSCGTGCGLNDFFCVNGANSDNLYLRNKNDECVRYFVQTDTAGTQRLAVTRDGLPASPSYNYVTPADVNISTLKFSTSSLTADSDYLSARLTIFISAKPVGGTDGQTLNLQTSIALRPFVCGQTIYDRDNFSYKTILIGDQCWMAENLKTRRKPDGTCINSGASYIAPQCTKIVSGIEYGGEDNSGRDCISTTSVRGTETQCAQGNSLYTWTAAMNGSTAEFNVQGICPRGWHLPSQAEFTELVTYYGGLGSAGAELKSVGSSGFNGRLIGNRHTSGTYFENASTKDFFWVTTQKNSSQAYYFQLSSVDGTVINNFDQKTFNYSVRCLKD